MYLEIALKYKVKQSKNGKFPPNYEASQIDYKPLKKGLWKIGAPGFIFGILRYIKISSWLRGKIANFSRLHSLKTPRRDLSTKKTKPIMEKWPESLGVM